MHTRPCDLLDGPGLSRMMRHVLRQANEIAAQPCDRAAALPFRLHERSEQPSAGPITFIELEGGAFWLTVGGDQQENFHYCAVPDRP